MPSYRHKKLIERIAQLDHEPDDAADYSKWIGADQHLAFLREDAKANELVVYGCAQHTFVHGVVVNEGDLYPLNKSDLLQWKGDPYTVSASYAYGGQRDDVWIERSGSIWGSTALKSARQLVYCRKFEGMPAPEASYFEISQEYEHATEIYWRPEHRAYCISDARGNLDHVVSVTHKEPALISFKWDPLEQYLVASNSVLVRMFDITLFRRGRFSGWTSGDEYKVVESDELFYRRKTIDGYAGYTRGIQIIRPRRPRAEVFLSIKGNSSEWNEGQYVEFLGYDWRNRRTIEISTDPTATTNYFEAEENSRPFELSPAFFNADVLLKYTADRDRYTIGDRYIDCRDAWSLRGYDVNDAGQVHAYICDLRNLPYQEQLYWKSFNEEPLAGISKRAVESDFKGEWSSIVDPLHDVLSFADRWDGSRVAWWKLPDRALLERVSTPRSASRDEWATAFMDLSKLIIEGFQVKAIRNGLEVMDIAFEENEKSIALLERMLIARSKIGDGKRLEGLRVVQHIRSTFAHSSNRKSLELANSALKKFDTFSAHFESVCKCVSDELRLIEEALS